MNCSGYATFQNEADGACPCVNIAPLFILYVGCSMKLSMPRFDQAPVLVVGDVMLDRYWHGGTSRISLRHRYRSSRSSKSKTARAVPPTLR
jgi:D-beta-D-heptose 7-phosphate kinase/D-beta-D-heptose 1-phosphate adenosyltransferase